MDFDSRKLAISAANRIRIVSVVNELGHTGEIEEQSLDRIVASDIDQLFDTWQLCRIDARKTHLDIEANDPAGQRVFFMDGRYGRLTSTRVRFDFFDIVLHCTGLKVDLFAASVASNYGAPGEPHVELNAREVILLDRNDHRARLQHCIL